MMKERKTFAAGFGAFFWSAVVLGYNEPDTDHQFVNISYQQ